MGLRLQFHSSVSGQEHGTRKIRNACKILTQNEGKGSLGKPRRRWEDHIKMNIKIADENLKTELN